ncbi:hypothetical protein C942_02882 [Photobacterium marinum]|uniref:Uncharacterized protein n=1 Tax=Photobacterium marinum TaxID=1056511 RepID=L8J648_9GAMM|nr:hypothetical protein C942_02882 [Photobacterium marinum]
MCITEFANVIVITITFRLAANRILDKKTAPKGAVNRLLAVLSISLVIFSCYTVR